MKAAAAAPPAPFETDAAFTENSVDQEVLQPDHRPAVALASIAETTASNSMNAINYLDEIRSTDQDEINIDGSKDVNTGIHRTTSTGVESKDNTSLLRQRSVSTAGRRQAGLCATSVLSNTPSNPSNNQLARPSATTQSRALMEDPEAQINGRGTW